MLWWDTRRDPLASYSGGILGGIRWRATLGYSAGCLAGSTGGVLRWDTRRDWRATLVGYPADSAGEPWRNRRDPLASRSGAILGGVHWRAALARYSAGSTGEQLWWDAGRDPLASSSGGDTRRDPLASCSGGILGGKHRKRGFQHKI